MIYRLLPLLIIIALFISLASIGIGSDSLWLDESESWVWATSVSLEDLITVTGQSNHAPTYYAALHGWIKIFGDSDTSIRLLSLVFMVCTIPLVYLLGLVIKSHRLGLIAVLLFASSPFIYEFAQEARPYSLLTLSATATLLICAYGIKKHIIENRESALIGFSLRCEKRKANLLWFAFFISLLVAITTHHTALVLLPIIGGLWFVLIMSNEYRWKHLFNLCVFVAVLALVYCAFFLSGFLISLGNFHQGGVSLKQGLFMLLIVYGNGHVLLANFLIVIPPLIAIWKLYISKQWVWAFFFLMTCTAMLLIVILIGEIHGSVFKWRTMIWVSVPCFVIIGYGLVSMRPWLCNILLSGIIITNIIAGVLVYQSEKQPWGELASKLDLMVKTEDAILVCPAYNYKSFHRYWRDSSQVWAYSSSTYEELNKTDRKILKMSDLQSGLKEQDKNHIDNSRLSLNEFVDKYNRIWVVASWHPQCHEMGDLVERIPFDGRIVMFTKINTYPSSLSIREID